MAAHDLDALIGGIGKSIKQALATVDEYGLQTFISHFESTPGAAGEPPALAPKMVTVPLPRPDGTYQARQIPVVALLHHSWLQIDELHVRMKVSMSTSEDSPRIKAEVGAAKREGSESPVHPETAEIDVSFKRGDPPEGLARIYTEYQKAI